MDEKIDIVVKPEMLRSIGRSWDGGMTGLSPFLFEMKDRAPLDKQAMVTAGICDKDGKILDRLRPAFEVLAGAQGFTRIYFTLSPGHVFEYICYATKDGRTASIINEAGDQRINYPAANEVALGGIMQIIGRSVVRNCDFKADLTAAETLVLAALMDLQRKEFLKAIADDKEQGPILITKEKIAPIVSESEQNYQWLVSIFKEMLDVRGTFMAEVIPEALNGLISKGLVKKEGGFYGLGDTLLHLSRRMLLIDRYITMVSGRLDEDNKLALTGFTCLQTGSDDFLMVDTAKASAHMETISSASLLDALGDIMTPGKYEWPAQSAPRVSLGSKRP